MKYYLGYYSKQNYVPIKDNEIGDNLSTIIEFTTKFPSIKKLKEYLYEKGLVPSIKVRLDYIIEKGKKDERYYKALNSTSKIYTNESKRFFNLQTIKETLLDESDNQEFIVYLNAKYIKKYGYLKRMCNFFYYLDNDKLLSVLKEMRIVTLSVATEEAVEKIISYFEKGNVNQEFLEEYIESFVRILCNEDADLTNLFTFLKKHIRFRNIPVMTYLSEWLKVSILSGQEIDIDSPTDVADRNNIINNFYNEIVYYFDYAKKEYKQEKNGNRKVNRREAFDLSAYLEEYYQNLYKDYVEEMIASQTHLSNENQYSQSTEYYEEENDSEEFLEEDDFLRAGTTSDMAGFDCEKKRWRK